MLNTFPFYSILQHLSPEVRAAADRAANREEKQRRLEVVEGLLWGPSVEVGTLQVHI